MAGLLGGGGLLGGLGGGSPDQSDAISAEVQRQLARSRQADSATPQDRVGQLGQRISDLADRMEQDEKKATSQTSGQGGLFGILDLFESLNVDAACQFAITRAQEAANGPVDTANVPIGGTGYDPASSGATTQTNGRILKWGVNEIVFLGRALMAFCMYFSIQLKWHVIEIVIGNPNQANMAGLGDLLIFGLLLGGGLGGSTTGTTTGGLGFLSNLFSFGSNAAVMNNTPFYPQV